MNLYVHIENRLCSSSCKWLVKIDKSNVDYQNINNETAKKIVLITDYIVWILNEILILLF